MARHVHIWEVDDGRGPAYFEANEIGKDCEVIDHAVDPTLSMEALVASFRGFKVSVHTVDGDRLEYPAVNR